MANIHSIFLHHLQDIQLKAKHAIAAVYQDELVIDPWSSHIGSGWTGICQGQNLEKAAVSISSVQASALPSSATALRPDLDGLPYSVTGLSIIFHPRSPLLPTSHANVRCFSVYKEDGSVIEWFGGGVDMTPYIPIEEDCQHWHQSLKAYIDRFEPTLYPSWKENCDQYFYLKHRQEPRGIGGIFFDDYKGFQSIEQTMGFVVGLLEWFLESHMLLAAKYQNQPYTQEQKAFQLWRRGRYVEFNLLQDRGTLFGLQAGGRVEAILLSLPPQVSWLYEGAELFSENNELLMCILNRYAADQTGLKKIDQTLEKA